MMSKACFGAAVSALICAVSACGSQEPAQSQDVVNESRFSRVVLVTIDTLRADHLRSYGYARTTSPFLDQMAAKGVEMILGVHHDVQFGPVIILGFGGVMAEVMKDVTFALPPFDQHHARRCIDKLSLKTILDGVRGNDPADIDAFCSFAARFSDMVYALRHELREVDINPVIVNTQGCVAIDALVVGCEADELGIDGSVIAQTLSRRWKSVC